MIADDTPGDPLRHFRHMYPHRHLDGVAFLAWSVDMRSRYYAADQDRPLLSEAAREGDFDRWLTSICPCSGDATSPLRVAGGVPADSADG